MGVRAVRAAPDTRTDAELASDAAAGKADAFDALYRRHAAAAWRVAHAVTANPEDAADAVGDAFTRVLQALRAGRLSDASLVRSYLLTAARNAAIDGSRRTGRVRSTDRLDQLDDGTKVSSPTDTLTDRENASFVARAFRSLPERWRSVLWLIEVEGIPPREAAALLGVSPNNAAQLAVRARASLRERFVQAHLTGAVADECRFTAERLGAYVTGRLSPRDLAKVDQHLAGCSSCALRRDELEDVGGALRRIAVPLPLLLGPAVKARWELTSAVSTGAAPEIVADAGGTLADLLRRMQKPLMAASTGIFAVGVIVAAPSVLGSLDPTRPGAVDRLPLGRAADVAAAPSVVPDSVRIVTASNASFTTAIADAARAPGESSPSFATDDASGLQAAQPPAPSAPSGDDEPAPPPPVEPNDGMVAVGVGMRAGPVAGGVALGDECQGVVAADRAVGECAPPQPTADNVGIAVSTGGTTPLGGRSVDLGV